MMNSIETVSILFLTKNAGPVFDRVIEQVESQEIDREVEIVVIDSGSTDGTVDRAATYADTLVEVDPEEFHHSRTRNLAAEEATGEVYVYLTQDALPLGDDWLESLLTPLTGKNVCAVYGRQVAYPDAKPMDKFFYLYFYPDDRRRFTATDVKDERKFYLENPFISDVAAAIDAEAFSDIGFRADVPMSEDKDFALRALDRGYELVYEPTAVVYHSHDYSLLGAFQRRYKDGKAYTNITTEGEDTSTSQGVDYFVREQRYLLHNGYPHYIPYAIFYDAMQFFGFYTGKVIGIIDQDHK